MFAARLIVVATACSIHCPLTNRWPTLAARKNPVEVSALETVGPEIDYDGLVAHRPEGIDDIDLPGPHDALVLILGPLQQWVILVLWQFGKAGTPSDVTKMVSMPRFRAVASTLCAFRIALFFSICRQRFLPQTPFGSQTLFCQCSISNAASGGTRLTMP